MLKKTSIRKILVSLSALFALFLIYLIPNGSYENKLNIDYELNYIEEDVDKEVIYLLDSYNMLGRSEIVFNEKTSDIELKARNLIQVLIKGGEGEDHIPNGFRSILSSETKILSLKYNEGIIKIDFSKDLLDIDIVKDINGRLYDTFQNRIIFPVIDENNNIIAFSGRKYLEEDLKDDTLPKYSNSKETIIFKKSNTFYNINNSLQNIKKSKEIIITEGFMDTIRMSSIGYKNVVALMGTAFTKDHLDKILKYKCKVVLNLDQDNAGKTATISIGEELLKNNIEVSVIVFDDYKDSDEFISAKGKEAFDIAYNNRIPFIDFKFKYLKSNKNMKDATDISKYINEAIASLNELDDDILKELKIKELSNEFNIDESIIRGKIKKSITKPKIVSKQEIKKKRYNKYDISEIRLLYLMLHYDDVILYFENTLGYLIHDNMSNLAHKIIEFRETYGYFDYSDFIDYVAELKDINETLKEVMMYHNDDNYTNQELDDYINTIKKYSIEEKIKKLKQEMNDTLDINKKIEIAKEIENINKEVLKW